MPGNTNEKSSYVTSEGRTIVDVDALLRKPKVQAMLRRLAGNKNLLTNHRGDGIAFVRRMKTDE
ncbi:MAG: hypothetical protein JOZ62_08920 [Acidobacteriaceae bacterium]|nr:hypothetical protein [Acidobacteriaceae bacterium]